MLRAYFIFTDVEQGSASRVEKDRVFVRSEGKRGED